MKKLIPLLGILCMGFQCDSHQDPIVNRGEWWVKNASAQSIWIARGMERGFENDLGSVELAPGASRQIFSRELHILKVPDFNSLYERWSDMPEEDISFEVLSDDGALLAKWSYSDRSLLGRQFFDESAWSRTQSSGDRVDEIRVVWLFEISDDDITQQNNI
ncbi:MAG: hypothetical protein LBV38_01255 [Alistipes sp.]|jgi:hypothetical protein|nr:hypothetical protein [Alistipes sp.]